MACITSADGQQFCDGPYTGFCSREKAKRGFDGLVAMTETGRIVATGPCSQCRTSITVTLYTPPIN